jgi:phosphoribosyl-ATP pyrophosphohydrolase|tara:strand:- start:408 stop:743 length:336 start_codon:yes stop_codon:yes gene_type:complete
MKDEFLENLLNLIKSKKKGDPKTSYTAFLHQKGLNEILSKISEEAEETIMAAKSEGDDKLVHEIADLWFHCLVLLSQKNLSVVDITNELKRREGISGIEEKNNRGKNNTNG